MCRNCNMATAADASSQPTIVSSYDVVQIGELFSSRFPSVKGKIFVRRKSNSSKHFHHSIKSLGFKEQKGSCDVSQVRSLDTMAIVVCGIAEANKLRIRSKLQGFLVVNYVANALSISNKRQLIQTVVNFENSSSSLVPRGLKGRDFLPATLTIGGAKDRHILRFLRTQRTFLVKPASKDNAIGIQLFRSDNSLSSFTDFLKQKFRNYKRENLLLQKYIEKPLLLDGRKFHLRVYLLVVANKRKTGVFAFVHPGYVRLTCRSYDLDSDDLKLHLTNDTVQEKDEMYNAKKGTTMWSPEELNDFLNSRLEQLRVPCSNWVHSRMYPRIFAILAHLVSIASASLGRENFAFELFGCDFLIDDAFNVWLLELNRTPGLPHEPKKTTAHIPKEAFEEAAAVAAEVLQLTHRQVTTKRLVTQQNFRKVYSPENESVIRLVIRKAGLEWPMPTNG